MILSSRRVILVVVTVAVAMAGLIVLQIFLLNRARDLKEQAFSRNVFAAINAAVQKLETGETMAIALGVAPADSQGRQFSIFTDCQIMTDSSTSSLDSIKKLKSEAWRQPEITISKDTMIYTLMAPQRVTIKMFDPDSRRSITVVDSFQSAGEHRVDVADKIRPGMTQVFKFQSDSSEILTQISADTQKSLDLGWKGSPTSIKVLARVLEDISGAKRLPIETRITRAALDSAVANALRDFDIGLEPVYGLLMAPGDSLVMANSDRYNEELMNSKYRTPLFPFDIFAEQSDLVMHFPGYGSFLWRQMLPLTMLTLFLTAVITACFAYTIVTIWRQKEFAVRMVDFINNMTHEFKTPLSTVALACDALKSTEVATDPQKINRFSGMIRDENNHMRSQVDRILQMAALENRDYEIVLMESDVHEIIRRTAGSVAIMVENRGGSLQIALDAPRYMLLTDPMHLTNVIHNLLDNAIKYSPDPPQIKIDTKNANGNLIISIADQGMGIPEKERRLVFEKYYRVSSGNRHDTKGFGIGLSYVKLIVEALEGRIDLKSEAGAGTTVELTFPLSA